MNGSLISFSILIPAYKAKYLKECLDSCLAQTYDNFEMIVVNDASPENLDAIMKPYEGEPRIKYYKNEKNCGAENVVDNWNICLKYASGMFVICMGDDDMLMPDCLRAYAYAIGKYPEVDEFHGRVRLVDERGLLIEILEDRCEHESAYANMLHRLEGRRQYIGDFCYRRERLLREGGFYNLPFAWGADDITSFMCADPNGVVNINTPIFCYRQNRYTISSSSNEEKKLVALLLEDEWIKNYINLQTPVTELECDELGKIRLLREKSLKNNQGYVIKASIRKSKLSIFKWLLVCGKYSVSRADVVLAFIRFLYRG